MISIKITNVQASTMWRLLIELSNRQPNGWTLIGAQMVALHGFEHNRTAMRTSTDADLLADVRTVERGTEKLSKVLLELGFKLDGMSPEGIGHRFCSEVAKFDVLGPDGLGRRTKLLTISPARTISVPGGTQAIARTELVEIELEGQTGVIPRPNLLGAILVKARAVGVDDAPNQQRQDLAFLLSLIKNPRKLAADIRPTERSWLRTHIELLQPTSQAWRGLENAEEGVIAFRILANL